MSIINPNVIDLLGNDPLTSEISLVMTDHLEWENDPHEHLLLIQEKLNKYLAYVESGEFISSFPHFKEKSILIELVLKFTPTDHANSVLGKFAAIVESAGHIFRWKLLDSSGANYNNT